MDLADARSMGRECPMCEVKVAIIGMGNCCSSLIQGIHYYRKTKSEDTTGLLTPAPAVSPIRVTRLGVTRVPQRSERDPYLRAKGREFERPVLRPSL